MPLSDKAQFFRKQYGISFSVLHSKEAESKLLRTYRSATDPLEKLFLRAGVLGENLEGDTASQLAFGHCRKRRRAVL